MNIELGIPETVGVAALVLVVGEFIRQRVSILRRYFIPGPVIGGIAFSLIIMAGHQSGTFEIAFDDQMRSFLLLVFFTTIGFSASFELLRKGGVAVSIFLGAAVVLVILQNALGMGLATVLGIHPLLGLSAGSISMTGGHGTAAAFGPLLEEAGATGAFPAAVAAATWGLVAGCAIGGPIGTLLMKRHKLQGRAAPSLSDASSVLQASDSDADQHTGKTALTATILLALSIGVGTFIVDLSARIGFVVPSYLGPMLVAAILRNIIDFRGVHLPAREFDIIGVVSLSFFLALALMSMRLWELADIAGPLLIILIAQTAFMAIYAYFVTFRVMGKDYDAAVIAAGHCGFGMGATANAMANMQAFTNANGPSPKAFFVIPLVGSLFIDFFNATIIVGFMGLG